MLNYRLFLVVVCALTLSLGDAAHAFTTTNSEFPLVDDLAQVKEKTRLYLLKKIPIIASEDNAIKFVRVAPVQERIFQLDGTSVHVTEVDVSIAPKGFDQVLHLALVYGSWEEAHKMSDIFYLTAFGNNNQKVLSRAARLAVGSSDVPEDWNVSQDKSGRLVVEFKYPATRRGRRGPQISLDVDTGRILASNVQIATDYGSEKSDAVIGDIHVELDNLATADEAVSRLIGVDTPYRLVPEGSPEVGQKNLPEHALPFAIGNNGKVRVSIPANLIAPEAFDGKTTPSETIDSKASLSSEASPYETLPPTRNTQRK